MGDKPVDSRYEQALQLAEQIEALLGPASRDDTEYAVMLTQALARGLAEQLASVVQLVRAAPRAVDKASTPASELASDGAAQFTI